MAHSSRSPPDCPASSWLSARRHSRRAALPVGSATRWTSFCCRSSSRSRHSAASSRPTRCESSCRLRTSICSVAFSCRTRCSACRACCPRSDAGFLTDHLYYSFLPLSTTAFTAPDARLCRPPTTGTPLLLIRSPLKSNLLRLLIFFPSHSFSFHSHCICFYPFIVDLILLSFSRSLDSIHCSSSFCRSVQDAEIYFFSKVIWNWHFKDFHFSFLISNEFFSLMRSDIAFVSVSWYTDRHTERSNAVELLYCIHRITLIFICSCRIHLFERFFICIRRSPGRSSSGLHWSLKFFWKFSANKSIYKMTLNAN